MIFKIRLLLIFALICQSGGPDVSTAPLTISRPNWGVIFNRAGTILNGITRYRHTFAIAWPKFYKSNLPFLPCDPDILYKTECEEINKLIANVTKMINIDIQTASASLEKAKKMIPQINIPTTRKKRDSGHALGGDYCNKMASEGDDDDASLIGTIGNVVSDIFGTPTSGDIKAIASHICNAAKLASLDEKEIHEANDRLTSMSAVLNDRITNIKSGISDAENRMTDLSNAFGKLIQGTNVTMNNLMTRVGKLEAFTGIILEILNGLNIAQQTVSSMSFTIDKWVLAINHLTNGYLPPFLVSVDDITAVLRHIEKNVMPRYNDQFVITHKNPSFYYQIRSVSYTRTDEHLIIMLTIPIHAVGGVLPVYRVDSTHISVSTNESSSTWIHGLPDYFAVTLDAEYYMELSTAQYASCRGETLKICSTETSLKRSTQKTCAASIYYDSADDIMRTCDIRYEEEMPVGHAIQLANHQYLVHSSNLTETWQLVCPQASSGFNEQNIESCNSCIIDIPCFCTLLATDFIIPYQLTECDVADPQYPKITYHFGVNLAMLHSLFEASALTEIKGNILKTNSKWKFPFPPLSIFRTSKWNDVVEKDKTYLKDFKKLMTQHKHESIAYATKADSLLRKAEDFSDLSVSKLHNVENLLGGKWLSSLFNPKAMIGGISVSMIFAVVAIILSIYNCIIAARR